MKNRGKSIFFVIVTAITALIQLIGGTPDVRAENVLLPRGTQITLQLNDALSTASNKEGDEFTATVLIPISIGNRIVIPKGIVVTGSVSRILHPDRLNGKAVLDLMFQSIRVPGYKRADISATLTRIDAAGSNGKQSAENFTDREKNVDGKVKPGNPKIGVRAQPNSEKNAGIGSSGGLPSVFNSQGNELSIPRGASMYITLDRPLTLIEETGKPLRK